MNDVGIAWTAEDIAAQSGVYRLLGRLWQHEVDPSMLRELRSPPVRASFQAVGGTVPDDDPSICAQLAMDYCQLFIGPANHLPPFQSVWQSGQFCGNAAVSMKQFAEIVGYDENALPRGLSLDHLGVQFDVMAHILTQIPVCKTEHVNDVVDLARSYFNTHLRWPKDLLTLAGGQALTEFYRKLIVMTRGFLELELHP